MVRTLAALVVIVGLAASVHVPPAGAQGAPAASAKPAAPVVNINTADAAGLATLPGIGPATADRIIAYRKENGPFKKIEELMNVRGIGEKSFLKLRAQITVGTAKAAEGGAK